MIRALGYAISSLIIAYWIFSNLRELIEHVGASSYQFLVAQGVSMTIGGVFKARLPRADAAAA